MLEIVIATRNPGKVAELARLWQDLPIEWLSLAAVGIEEELAETGATIAENARQKAERVAALWGGWALADDSGLYVQALDGRPGVISARYGGDSLPMPGKWALLLDELASVPANARQAWFACVLALAHPQHETVLAEGEVHGQIGFAPKGSGGFGYDPLFVLPERGLTMAELPAAEKDIISHRGRAAQALHPHLGALVQAE